jgi:hypothetical protein
MLDFNYLENVFFLGNTDSTALVDEALRYDFHLPLPADTLSMHGDLDSEINWLSENLDCSE